MDPDAERLREDLAILTPFAVEVRYPDDGLMPSEADATEARDSAGTVLTWLRDALPAVLEEGDEPGATGKTAAEEDTEKRPSARNGAAVGDGEPDPEVGSV